MHGEMALRQPGVIYQGRGTAPEGEEEEEEQEVKGEEEEEEEEVCAVSILRVLDFV